MKATLLAHVRRYPLMEPTDAVKLLYQSEFGGGHLIRDEQACLRRLQREYAATPQDPQAPLLENIGGGLVRVNLAALDGSGYSLEALGRDFIRSAAEVGGTLTQFREKLNILRKLTEEGHMPFSPEELESYLINYEQEGFPPVSHSSQYREAYHPAYRIILKQMP